MEDHTELPDRRCSPQPIPTSPRCTRSVAVAAARSRLTFWIVLYETAFERCFRQNDMPQITAIMHRGSSLGS
jgi:hypothetical protein